jgi:hypothetical protein
MNEGPRGKVKLLLIGDGRIMADPGGLIRSSQAHLRRIIYVRLFDVINMLMTLILIEEVEVTTVQGSSCRLTARRAQGDVQDLENKV